MILYFTGTGNSKYIADALNDKLKDEIVSLNHVIKNNEEKTFHSETPFIIVAPIYAWRLPRIIEKFLETSVFTGNRKMYFVVTMGSETGNCDEYCKNICKKIDMEFMGLRGIPMANNYVVFSKMPDKDTVKTILSKALLQVDETAETIKNSEKLQKTDKTLMPKLMSGIVNDFFYKFIVTDKNFNVSGDCTKCGLCEKLCPINNIIIKNEKPEFKGSCINCYSCIHHCPKSAINIKNKTQNHGRYVCPQYKKEG